MSNSKHEPTDETREQVKLLAAYGTQPECIARVQRITLRELQASYKDELETAEIEAVAKVAESLYRRAIGTPAGGGKPGTPGDNVAAIYILETRGGWKKPTK